MEVYGGLVAGSETCRLSTNVRIVLHGARVDIHSQADSYKGIVVYGRIDLHGRQLYRTWSRLAAPARPGDTVLLLQHAVNWEAGQHVVLTTTALKDARDWHRNEEFVLATADESAPEGVNGQVALASPVQFVHEANAAYQAEVGLLSRSITVEGAEDDSEPTDVSPVACEDSEEVMGDSSVPCPDSYLTGYGGHIRVSGPGAVGRLRGVELLRMGQTNVMGHYPMHYHLVGTPYPGSSNYVSGCSVHRSFYRCIAIHGTDNVTLEHNVGYDVIGHCYYLEDGVEQHNRIEYNLAALVHFIGAPARSDDNQFMDDIQATEDLRQPADASASCFYITNVLNIIVGNAASGGWAGFQFPTLAAPIKDHRDDAMFPADVLMGRFDGNSAHSSGYWWGSSGIIYFGGSLWEDTSTSDMTLSYNGGRDGALRDTCQVLKSNRWNCNDAPAWTRVTNLKLFLTRGVAFNVSSSPAQRPPLQHLARRPLRRPLLS